MQRNPSLDRVYDHEFEGREMMDTVFGPSGEYRPPAHGRCHNFASPGP